MTEHRSMFDARCVLCKKPLAVVGSLIPVEQINPEPDDSLRGSYVCEDQAACEERRVKKEELKLADVKVTWKPFTINEDGLLKEPMIYGYGYPTELFENGFESIQDFRAFLETVQADPWDDPFNERFVLLPVFRRTAHGKR